MADLDTALVLRIEATQRKLETQMTRAQKVVRSTTTDMQNRMTRAGTQMTAAGNGAASGMSRLINISGRGRFVLQNTAAQVGDIAVQLEGGTAASRVMAQQFPQLLGGFGALGGALGIVAPLLGTVAAVGIPIAAMFLANQRASKGLEESTRTLSDAVRDYTTAANAANLSSDEIAEKYGTAEAAARDFIVALREIEGVRATEQLDQSVTDLAGTFATFADGAAISMAEAGRQIQNLQSDYDALSRAASQAVTVDESNAANQALRDFEVRQRALMSYRDALEGLQATLGVTTQEAGQLADAMVILGNADGPRQQAAAANGLLDAMRAVLGDFRDMDGAARSMYQEVRDIGDAAAELQGAIEGSATAAFDLMQNIAAAGNSRLGGLIADADTLAASLGTAAAAAWDVVSGIAEAANKRQLIESGQVGPDAALNDVRDRLTTSGIDRSTIVSRRTYGNRSGGRSSGGRSSGGAGGSGGGGGAAQPGLFADIGQEITALERQIDMIGRTSAEVAGLTAKYALLDEAKRRGLDLDAQQGDSGETLIAQIDAQAQAVQNLTAQAERYAERAEFIADKNQQLRDSFIDAAIEGEGLSGALSQLAKDLAKAALNAALFNQGPFSAGAGGGGFMGLVSGLVSGLPSFDGGGTTGGGARAGGVDGIGGFPAILHKNERIVPDGAGGAMDIRVFVDQDGNWQAAVDRISQANINASTPTIVAQANRSTIGALRKSKRGVI